MKIAICTFPTMIRNDEGKLVSIKSKYMYRTSSPYNIYLLAAIMEQGGYDVTIKDWISNDFDMEEAVDELLPFDIVMMSCPSWAWTPARFLMENLHSRKDQIIILGGIHATLFSEEIIKEFPVDYIVCGEGEKSVLPLLRAIEEKISLKDVPGLVYKEKGEVSRNTPAPLLTGEEMDKLPLPLYEHLPPGSCKWLAIESSRGCVNNCIFCSDPYKKSWRALSAKAFVDRIESSVPYLSKVTSGDFLIIDDSFIINVKRAMEIAGELKKRNLEIKATWNAQVRELGNRDMLSALSPYTNGILMGAESFNEDTLKKIGKKISPHDILAAVKTAKELDIGEKLIFSFIIGFPWQTREMIIDEIDKIYDIVCLSGGMAIINWLLLTPGSQMWHEYHNKKDIPFNNYGNAWRDWHREFHPRYMSEINFYISYLQSTLPDGFYRIQAPSNIYKDVCWL